MCVIDAETLAKPSVDVESVEAYSARLPTIAKIYSPDDTLLGTHLLSPALATVHLAIAVSKRLCVPRQGSCWWHLTWTWRRC